jgi:hypothetical protein
MTVSRHAEEAVARLQEAEARIARMREDPLTLESQRAWLEALTVYCYALADIHTFNNESIHEKLHELAGVTGLKKFRSSA